MDSPYKFEVLYYTISGMPKPTSKDREILTTREFSAVPEKIWKAWTDPTHTEHWWRRDGFTSIIQGMKLKGVVKPKRLTYTNSSEPPFDMTVTLEEEKDGITKVNMRMLFQTPAERDTIEKQFGASEKVQQTLDRLGEYLHRMEDDDYSISRTFNYPRDVLWRAWTEPDELKKWWGPKGLDLRIHKLELKPKGLFHYKMQSVDRHDLWGKFVYTEVVKPERIIFVGSFSDEQGGITRHPMIAAWPLEVLNHLTFLEYRGKTTLRLQGGPINATEEEIRTFKNSRELLLQGLSGTLDQLSEHLCVKH